MSLSRPGATSMLNLHHLRIFRTLAEEGSFTRAAEVLFISQPAVSREVRSLEQALGIALVDRVGRGMVLTEAGKLLAELSAQLFGLERDIEETMDELRGARRGRLSV